MKHCTRAHRPFVSTVALFVALAAHSCSDGGGASSKAAPGARLFAEKGCVACHGARGEGAFMGPPLRALAQNWKREELSRFFADPSSRAKADERLSALAKRYPAPMTPIVASESERLALADWVLAFE